MSDPKYGTKATRLRQAMSEISGKAETLATEKLKSDLNLPALLNTEDALRFGAAMTRTQYLLLEGARQAIGRMYQASSLAARYANKEPARKAWLQQLAADLAFQGQLIREALENAPTLVLASITAPIAQDNFAGGHGTQGEPAAAYDSAHETAPAKSL